MASTELEKPHAVIIPYPSQGHINPIKQFATLLHGRGFHITFVNTEFIHKGLIETKGPDSVKGLPDFRYETIPDGLPLDDKNGRHNPFRVADSASKHSVTPLKELIIKLNSSPDVPPVTCIVSDVALSFTMHVTKELSIPEARFWTAPACCLITYSLLPEVVKRGLLPLKDESYKTNGYLDTPLDWVQGMKGVRLKDIPSFFVTTAPVDLTLKVTTEQIQTCKYSNAVIMNTFYEFEKEVLESLVSDFPPIYTIGPLTQHLTSRSLPNPLVDNTKDPNCSKEDTEWLEWLDRRDPKSVVYVNFESNWFLSEEETKTFASGLANYGFDFLWVLRADIVKGEKSTLPEFFVEETKERGLIVSQCPLEKVLKHPSVGLFVTHGGWSCMLETLITGVPVLCWVFGADQNTNTRQVCLVWKNGMEIEKNVNGSELAELLREMMVGDEKGKEKREKALEWKKKAEEATSEGGSSSVSFHKLVNEVLLLRNQVAKADLSLDEKKN